MSPKIETESICTECTENHIRLNQAPICCSVGRVALNPGEAERVSLPSQTTSISIEGGCQLWNTKDRGCSVFPDRPQSCRRFPSIESYTQLLFNAVGIYKNCPLIQFLLALWERRIEADAAIIHSDENINNVPLFDKDQLNLVANFLHWYNNPPQEARQLLEKAKEAHFQTEKKEPVVTLFFIDQLDGGIHPTKPFTLSEIEQLEYQEGYPILAGLVYPSIKNLPPGWLTKPLSVELAPQTPLSISISETI